MVDAFVLAHELARHRDDAAKAFAAYEERMRPYVDLNQALVDLTCEGPVLDEQLNEAKNGIEIADLLAQTL